MFDKTLSEITIGEILQVVVLYGAVVVGVPLLILLGVYLWELRRESKER